MDLNFDFTLSPMEQVYLELIDQGQQLSAEIDAQLRENPDSEDLKETQGFLADRLDAISLLIRLQNG